MNGKKRWLLTAVLIVWTVLSGCSSSGTVKEQGKSESEASKQSDPVTIKMLIWDVNITDDDFKTYIADPVKSKYPYITVEMVRRIDLLSLDQMVQQVDFDMIYEGTQTINQFIVNKYAEDISGYIKKNKMDLNKFEPILMNAIKSYGKNGEVYGVPVSMDFNALFYNKDLFDRFAVPYPKDGMTWEEVKDVMPKLIRNDGGKAYYGLHFLDHAEQLGSPYAYSVYDEKTGKAVIATEGWKKVFALYRDIMNYAGNQSPSTAYFADRFVSEQNVAMITGYGGDIVSRLEVAQRAGKPLNWDMVTYPSFSDLPGRGLEVFGHLVLMSSTSKHKDDVFRIFTVMTEDEVQLKIAKSGRLPSLNNAEIRKHYGENLQTIKGKNLNPINKLNPAPMPDRTGNALIARKSVRPVGFKTTEFMKGTMDVNTALQLAEEAANKAIADAKKQ